MYIHCYSVIYFILNNLIKEKNRFTLNQLFKSMVMWWIEIILDYIRFG